MGYFSLPPLNSERLITGSKNLDDLFGGRRIETGTIKQFYGAPGSGKAQLCYTVCALSTSEYKAIFIDTESTFPLEELNILPEQED
jgi:RecA/RadA recombinase